MLLASHVICCRLVSVISWWQALFNVLSHGRRLSVTDKYAVVPLARKSYFLYPARDLLMIVARRCRAVQREFRRQRTRSSEAKCRSRREPDGSGA
jgi:hypothetical protein